MGQISDLLNKAGITGIVDSFKEKYAKAKQAYGELQEWREYRRPLKDSKLGFKGPVMVNGNECNVVFDQYGKGLRWVYCMRLKSADADITIFWNKNKRKVEAVQIENKMYGIERITALGMAQKDWVKGGTPTDKLNIQEAQKMFDDVYRHILGYKTGEAKSNFTLGAM